MQLKAKKKIVVCASRFPYPLEKGDKLRLYYQLETLSRYADITLICTSDVPIEPQHYEKVKTLCSTIHVFPLTKLGLILQLFTSLLSATPFQVSYFFRYAYKRKIHRILEEVQPDWIFCQLIRMSEYVKDYHKCPKTIDYMDALSKGMERRIEETAWWKSWFYTIESKRLRQYERKIFDYFEQQIMISEQDRNYIQHPNQKDIEIVPNGVSERFFETLPIQKDIDIVFTGNFSYAPNILAAQTLVKEILPQLHKANYFPKVMLAGASPHASVKELASEHVIVTGWVDDIREAYQRSHLFVAPLFIGTGLQNKVLEAMASGLPCVITPLVNNALHGSEGENVLLAKNIHEFVEIYKRYTKETTSFNTIGNSGKEFVTLQYSWETINQKLLRFL